MSSHHTPTSSALSQPPIPISITICGDGGCGKSSITLRLVRNQWTPEYDPTIEDSYSITQCIDGVNYHLSLTDTAGQEEYRSMWASSNLDADAFLLVYDMTSRGSLDALQYYNDLIDMEAETRLENAARARRAGLSPVSPTSPVGHDSLLAGNDAKTVAPVKMVVGNKSDLQDNRQVPSAVGLEWARRRGCLFMETSALFGANIEQTFVLMVRSVVESRRKAEMEAASDGVGAGLRSRGMTKPLTPLPTQDGKVPATKPLTSLSSKAGKEPRRRGLTHRLRRFWKKLRLW